MNRAITNCNRIDCRRNVKRTYKSACQFHAYTLVKRSFILADWHVRFTTIHQSRNPLYFQIGMLDSRLYTSQEILYTCRLACQIHKYTLVKRSYILADWHVRFTNIHQSRDPIYLQIGMLDIRLYTLHNTSLIIRQ